MTPAGFCQYVEGRLGWEPPHTTNPYARYAAEATKVKRKIATDPARYTWRNLKIAVEFLRRRELTRTPVGVFAYVDAALARSAVPDDQVEAQLSAAIAEETMRGDPDGWAARMMRARGKYRLELLQEWHER